MEKERKVKLMLSDDDWQGLMELCGKCSMTVGDLLTHFANDLLDTRKSNGSDERRLAQGYYERGGWQYDDSLLAHILRNGNNPVNFLTAWEGWYLADNPDDVAYYDDWLTELCYGWRGRGLGCVDEEDVALIKRWVAEK